MTPHPEPAATPTAVLVPGMRDASSEHWQAILAARLPGARQVTPLGRTLRDVSEHVAALQQTLDDVAGPVILVAHSAGVITTVHWASRHRGQVTGAPSQGEARHPRFVPGAPVTLRGRTAEFPRSKTRSVIGALLATPPDLVTPLAAEYPSLDELADHGWLPVPTDPLPFPSILATSANDPLSDPARIRAFGKAWGSDVRSIGAVGHLNPASGYGEWPDAQRLLDELADM